MCYYGSRVMPPMIQCQYCGLLVCLLIKYKFLVYASCVWCLFSTSTANNKVSVKDAIMLVPIPRESSTRCVKRSAARTVVMPMKKTAKTLQHSRISTTALSNSMITPNAIHASAGTMLRSAPRGIPASKPTPMPISGVEAPCNCAIRPPTIMPAAAPMALPMSRRVCVCINLRLLNLKRNCFTW